jgi:hypothetical protein
LFPEPVSTSAAPAGYRFPIAAGHAFLQNLRRGHDELGVDERANDRIRTAFTKLAASL